MENTARIIGAFRGIFLTAMTLLLGVATGVGWFMARRAVSGVEAVTRTARTVSEEAWRDGFPSRPAGMRSISWR